MDRKDPSFHQRLAYAMTDNNCEGQMMKRVLLGISNSPFASVSPDLSPSLDHRDFLSTEPKDEKP
jgi:hypothetical protein